MQLRPIGHLGTCMGIVGIRSPGKVVDIFGDKMPVKVSFLWFHLHPFTFVAVPDFIGVLQSATAPYGVARVNIYGHVIVAPHAMKLPRDVFICMPSLVIILCHFGVPLGHGVGNALFVVAPRPSYLKGHLGFKLQGKGGLGMGQDGPGEGYGENGAVHPVAGGLPILFQVQYFLVPYLVLVQLGYPVHYPSVGVGKVAGTHVHHAARLKGVEVKVVINFF